MNKVKRYVVAHDLHYPMYNKPTFEAMMAFIEDIKPDGFFWGGDQLDNLEISHHTKGKPFFRERGAYKRNNVGFDRDILTRVEKALPKGCEKVWIDGNHERFSQDFIEEHPELEWMLDHVTLLRLKERGWEVIPLGHCKRLGELVVAHGEVLSGVGNQCGLYPSKKAVELYGCNVLAGHTHAPQSFSKVSPVDQKKKYMGWVAPVLCDCNPAYIRNRPTSWINGFTVVELHGNKGLFNLYPIIVIDGEFAFGGKIYRAKK